MASPSNTRKTSRGTRASVARRAGVLLLAACTFATSSCHSTGSREPWSFCLSRACYKDGGWISAIGNSSGSSSCPEGGGAVALLALVLLPIAIDLAILPVTGVHDVCD